MSEAQRAQLREGKVANLHTPAFTVERTCNNVPPDLNSALMTKIVIVDMIKLWSLSEHMFSGGRNGKEFEIFLFILNHSDDPRQESLCDFYVVFIEVSFAYHHRTVTNHGREHSYHSPEFPLLLHIQHIPLIPSVPNNY